MVFPAVMLLRGTPSLAKTDEKKPFLSEVNHFQAARKALPFSATSEACPLSPMVAKAAPP